jgi:uncharacterized protein YtpQ (UPF0354 family)
MVDNQDLIIPEVVVQVEDVLVDMEGLTEGAIQEMIEVVEEGMIKAVKIATVDVVDGNSCKT